MHDTVTVNREEWEELQDRVAALEELRPFIVGLGQAINAAAQDTNLQMMSSMLPPQVQNLLNQFRG